MSIIGNPTLQELIDALSGNQNQNQFPGVPTIPGGTIATTGTSLTTQQIQTLLQGLSTGITKEEKEELERLRLENKADTKKAKIDVFKRLPADFRQHIINMYIWHEVFVEMNSTKTPKSQRQIDLENKENFGTLGPGISTYLGGQLSVSIHDSLDFIPYPAHLPESITLDDLKQAHLDASMEEEILKLENPK